MTTKDIDQRTGTSRDLSRILLGLSLMFIVGAAIKMNGHRLHAAYIRPELPVPSIYTQYNSDGSVAIAGTVPDDITRILSPKAKFVHDMMNLSSTLVHILPLLFVPLVLTLALVSRKRPISQYLVTNGLHLAFVVIQWYWAYEIS